MRRKRTLQEEGSAQTQINSIHASRESNMEVQVMSEAENDQRENTRAPRFSKAAIGRILAVACFIALGTFAVMNSMQTQAKTANTESGSVEQNQEGEGKTLLQKAGETANKLKTGLVGKTTKPANPEEDKNKKLVGKSPTTTPTPKGIAPTFGNGNSFNATTQTVAKPKTAPPISQSFSPAVVKPKANSTASTTMPPPRYAQANSGIPVIGNNNGFGTRADNLKKAVTNTLGEAAQSTADNAKKVTDATKAKANELLKKTSEKLGNATNDLRNGFGPIRGTPKTNNITQSKSPFGPPPKVNSNFGGTTQQKVSVTAPPIQTQSPSSQPITTPPSKSFAPIVSAPKKSNSASPFGPKPPVTTQSNSAGFGSSTQLGSSNRSTTQLPGNGTTKRTFTPPSTQSFGNSSRPANQKPLLNSAPITQQRPLTQPSRPPVQPITSNTAIQTRPASTTLSNPRPSSRLSTTGTVVENLLTKNVPGDRQLDGIQAPALTIQKFAPREIQVNQSADFQLVIKNVGRVTAEDVRVFDKVPEGTEFQNASPEPVGLTRTRDLEWRIGKLRPGQEKRIKIQLKPIRPGEIGSVAHVTFAAQASMRTLVTRPVLDITHSAKRTHLIGDDVIFDVTVQNKGDGPANNVLIQEDVPKQLEFQEGYRELEYEIGTLMPGQSRSIQLALKAADIGKLRNVMFASADGGLRAKHEIDLEVIAPNLIARSNGPTKRYLQRAVTHEFGVVNKGTAKATNVEMIARLPSGLRFVSANNQGSYRASTHTVHWSLAELERDVDAKVELKTIPVEVGNQPIKFESFADLDIKTNAEQPLSVEHLVDVFFDIDDVVDPIEIGSDTSYRIRVVNQGTKTASNVQLQVAFPVGLQPTSVDGSIRHNISGQNIIFEPINTMSPGDEISFVVHGTGQRAGDHRVVVSMRTDGRQTPVAKEETTRVYSDR